MARLLQTPAFHFIVIGALLFALTEPIERRRAPEPEPIVISAGRRAEIRDTYTRETGLAITANDEKALLDREVREELLYREALAQGLHLHDRSIQWRLASKMEFLASADGENDARGHDGADDEALYRQAIELGLDRDDVIVKRILVNKIDLLIRLQASDDVPDEATLRRFYDEHRTDYVQSPRVTFTHVFASHDKRGERAEPHVHAVLGDLAAGRLAPADAVRQADPFPLGHEYRARSSADVTKIFGDTFAAAVMNAGLGRWSGPIQSAHGWHAVWVESRRKAAIPDFETVRSRVFQRYVNERRTAHLEETLRALHEKYRIVIESDGSEPRGS
jgi:hypothetical protein